MGWSREEKEIAEQAFLIGVIAGSLSNIHDQLQSELHEWNIVSTTILQTRLVVQNEADRVYNQVDQDS